MALDPSYIPTKSGLLSTGYVDKTSIINVGNINTEYAKAMTRWQLCRDVTEGEDIVRSKGTLYLPKPSGQTEQEYTSYSLRASFTNATGRALDGLEGLIFRKKPTSLMPEEMEEIAEDITTTGLTLDELAKYATDEVIRVGRGGLLVEYPTTIAGERTISDVEEDNEHPYLTFYPAEAIIDWREGRIKNKKKPTFVKLREWLETPSPTNPMETETIQLIRIIQLNAEGYCEQLEYLGSLDQGVIPTIKPIIINGEPLKYIPFVFLGPMGTSPSVSKPPIYDIAIKNVHHWQVSADRANAVHWSDCPTPVVIGNIISTDGAPVETIKLGSTTVLNIAQGSDAKFLEFMGHGLVATKELMQEYMSEMAILLSRILAGDSKAAEAAETAAIHRAGENAVLASIANSISSGFTKALQIMAKWLKLDDQVSYRLNTNFYPTPLSSQNLIALTNALIARTISQEEFFEALVAGDVIRPDKTLDQHKEEIAAMPSIEVQTGGALNPMNPANAPQDQNHDTKSPGSDDETSPVGAST